MLVEFIKSLGSMPAELFVTALAMELLLAGAYYLTREATPGTPATWPSAAQPCPLRSDLADATQPQPFQTEFVDFPAGFVPNIRSSSLALDVAMERRRSARYTVDVGVRGEVVTGERRPIHGRSVNFCQHGMLLILPYELNVGDVLRIAFTIRHYGPIELEAVIRNRRGLAYGIEFVNVTPEQQACIEHAYKLLEFSAGASESVG